MNMKKIIILLFLLICNYGYCCDCQFKITSFIEKYNSADIIFQGKVTSIKRIKLGEDTFQEVVLDNVKNFKNANKKSLTIYNQISNCALGISEIGEEWIIWAYFEDNKIQTNQCTQSNLVHKYDSYLLNLLKDLSASSGYKKWYDKDGKLEAEGDFTNHKANGVWIYYNNNCIMSEINYKDGLQNGDYVIYYQPIYDILNSECKDEFSKMYNSNNYKIYRKIEFKGSYKNGKKENVLTSFNFNGSINYSEEYKNGMLDGISKYYSNGVLENLYSYKENKYDGACLTFYKNGIVKSIFHYKDGIKVGKWQLFNEFGKIVCDTDCNNIYYDEKSSSFQCKP